MLSAAALVLLMLTLLSGCAKNKVRSAIDEVNRHCPVQVSMFVRMLSAGYDNDCVSVRYELDDRMLKIEGFRDNAELMKKMMLAGYEQQKEFVDAILDAGASLQFDIEGRTSGERFTVTISPDELRQTQQGLVMTPQERMEASIMMVNAQGPMKLAEGMTMTGMRVEGDCAYYLYEVSPEVLANLQTDADGLKTNVRYALENLSEADKADLRNISNAGKNLGYRYTCPDTGQSVEFFFTQSQLVDILR